MSNDIFGIRNIVKGGLVVGGFCALIFVMAYIISCVSGSCIGEIR